MATPGYGGKILLVDLSRGTGEEAITRLDTEKYEKFGGGYGFGAAMFWDYCVAPGDWDLQDAFHPRNMVSLMTGPLSGTGVPGGARTSVSGLSPQCYPIQWFGHSNFGGMFATMLRMAGWDGVSVIGRAENPVYINIVDDKVTIEDARNLWGLNAWECQEEIYKRSGVRFGDEWWRLESGYTLQRPQIVTIGAAGEKMTRVASLTHAGGSGAGQGGFGGVFGAKNLKAVAVIGTGRVRIADSKGMRDTREWWDKTWPRGAAFAGFGPPSVSSSCIGCGTIRSCHNRDRALSKDSDDCAESTWYTLQDIQVPSDVNQRGTDICQQLTINGMETCFQGHQSFDTSHNPDFPIQPKIPAYAALGWYMKTMYDMGVIGPGTKFDTSPLPMDKYGTREFMEIYGYAIANRVGIGNLLAEGTDRFCEALGRKDDFNVLCRRTPWGYCDHWSMPNVEWAYSNLFDSRDVNCHDFGLDRQQGITCEEYVKTLAARTGVKHANEFWFDYSWEGDQAYKTGIYSRPKAEFVTWHHHYWLYYKESIGFCDWGYMSLYNGRHAQRFGHTPEAEPRWMSAITGKNHSFMEDGIKSGRRIFSMLRAIYAMQGRHKDMEKFNGYYYRPGASYCGWYTSRTVYDGREWDWKNCRELYFTEKGIETMKEHVYEIEGWNRDSGYPTRKTLEELELKHVADYLQSKGKLG
ncbi:MAG: hypothetical protein FWF13_05890 [Acidobacteria bacterium]|nr:hypothetical protein [Acidobacteriota bacterium]